MRVTGIIAECNPFHEGHAHLLSQARKETGADYIVVVLSGDYVQRGAPAVMGWERRVPQILAGGADLVLALPLYVSCSGADYFARGAVALLQACGVVSDLCFGSESADLTLLTETSKGLAALDMREESTTLRESLRRGLPYPAARAAALQESGIDAPERSNDILAAEYLKALLLSESAIRPHALPLLPCPSASSRREQLRSTPPRPGDPAFLFRDDFSGPLLHALFAAGDDPQALSQYLDVSPDLASRILNLLPQYDSFSGFCGILKNRSLTYTRVSRALLHILLGMTDESMEIIKQDGMCSWIRPLGVRRSALPLVKMIAANCSVPYLSRPADAGKLLPARQYALLQQEFRAELFYDLTAGGTGVKPALQKPLLFYPA